MEGKGQVSRQGYKARFVIIAGIRRKNAVKSSVWRIWCLVNVSGSELNDSFSKLKDSWKLTYL